MGRVKDAGNTVQYSWPGVYFEGRVRGTGVGIVLNDYAADYDVQIDGATVTTLVTPGNTTAAGYRSAYGDFLQKLRAQYGNGTTIVAVGAGQYAGHVQQVVKARNDAGDRGVRYWFLDDSGLDFLGCDWHYSAHDDRLIADRLVPFITGLPTGW
ncbi:hypothetical protein ACFTWD_11670 [Streptomyces sp. NPDC056943]|uniref:hypothetical protein n=1 Tax=Streptomyces sp. NPDC056943 TaxID=3345971 RepID=UPI003644AFE9